ncbi:ferric-chelate reductase 1 [Ditylenchus destructor]|uniref:Ferric-chelate reductase 1 n=1 Tax=Ditylenchus destructor TaxID=166010 RepID=A0AAD4N7L3_9BILA|nr:ferric-chelate reductase 1 [Ditylenchus destructor]
MFHLFLRNIAFVALPVFLCNFATVEARIDMNRNGCGETKGCMFKPAGCDPQLDCTLGIIFFVSESNKLTVQMVAQSLLPAPPLQYIAVGFSKDALMGDDFVSECVLSPAATTFSDVEVFASFNYGKTNDRTYLNATEHGILFDQIEGEAVDGRLMCQFAQQILPQMDSKDGKLSNLNRKYFIIGATGSAQPDEINVHDISIGSHFYPIVSARPINPSLIGKKLYELPPPMIIDSAASADSVQLMRMGPRPAISSTDPTVTNQSDEPTLGGAEKQTSASADIYSFEWMIIRISMGVLSAILSQRVLSN